MAWIPAKEGIQVFIRHIWRVVSSFPLPLYPHFSSFIAVPVQKLAPCVSLHSPCIDSDEFYVHCFAPGSLISD